MPEIPNKLAGSSEPGQLRHGPVMSGASRAPDPAPAGSAPYADGEGGGWSSQSPYLFHLSQWAPNRYEGGTLRGANEDDWDILKGQEGSVYLVRLEPGGVREPHWHPSAWEFNFVISGRARWAVLGLQGEHALFEAGKGDLIFAPQGHFHYFENAGEDDLVVLVIFNTSAAEPRDDIGLVASLSVIPPEVLGTLMGVSPEVFTGMKRRVSPVTIVKRSDVRGRG